MLKMILHSRHRGHSAENETLGDVELTRVPCVGEFVSLGEDGPYYRIRGVQHLTGDGDYAAHLYGDKMNEKTMLESV